MAETEKNIRPIFDGHQHASYKAILAQYPAIKKQKTPIAGHISGCVDKYFESYIRELNQAIGGIKIKPSHTSKPDSAKLNATTGNYKKSAASPPSKSDSPETNRPASEGETPAADATGTPPIS